MAGTNGDESGQKNVEGERKPVNDSAWLFIGLNPELPEGIRQAVLTIWQPGDLLLWIITDQGIEWRLPDDAALFRPAGKL